MTQHQSGDLAEAERLYRQVVAHQPEQFEALHYLALVLRQRGRLDEAIDLLIRATAVNPKDAVVQNNCGNMLRERGRLDEALVAYRAAVRNNPDHINARFNLGAILQDLGDFSGAAACYHHIVQVAPDDADAWIGLGTALSESGDYAGAVESFEKARALRPNDARVLYNLGTAFKGQDRLDEAADAYRQAVALNPDYAEAHNNLGSVLKAQGLAEQAEAAYLAALRSRPDYGLAHYNLACTYMDLGRVDAAAQAYTKTIELEPDNAKAYNDLGMVLLSQGRAQSAADAFSNAIHHDPEWADAHSNLGLALGALGRLDDAIKAHQAALRLEPDFAVAHNNLGLAYMDKGDIEAAQRCYRKALELDPKLAQAYYNIAGTRRFGADDEAEIERMTAQLGAPGLPDEALANLHFALGKVLDDRGSYDAAFEHYRQANRLKRKAGAFDAERHVAWVSQMIDIFDAALFERCGGFGDDSELPVFIVGMPRSGTTLVEQIISSHPQAYGADELTLMKEISARLPAKLHTDLTYPECMPLMNPEVARSSAAEYLTHLVDLGGDAIRVMDKMPTNFLHLGLIAVLLPRARVVHCRRDPLDVCLSNYFQQFAHGHFYSYDLADIAVYYREYRRLMGHWREVLPIDIFELQYEELVADQETISQRLIDYCGLPWDERCIEFHRAKRAVRTASNWQVRQPIYKRSSKRWKNYERSLGQLKRELGYQEHA